MMNLLTEVFNQLVQICFFYVQAIVFPSMTREPSILLIIIMARDPKFRQPIQVCKVKGLYNP